MEFDKNNFIKNYKNLEILKNEYLEILEKNWNPEIDSEEKEEKFFSESIDFLIKKYEISEDYEFYSLNNEFLILENSEFQIKIKI